MSARVPTTAQSEDHISSSQAGGLDRGPAAGALAEVRAEADEEAETETWARSGEVGQGDGTKVEADGSDGAAVSPSSSLVMGLSVGTGGMGRPADAAANHASASSKAFEKTISGSAMFSRTRKSGRRRTPTPTTRRATASAG